MKLISFQLGILAMLISGMSCHKHTDNLSSQPSPSPAPGEKKWMVTTVAGDGRPVFEDGDLSTASFRLPLDVAVAPDDNLYVADFLNHRIRKVTLHSVITFAGSGVQDTTNGAGISAGFSFPSRLAFNQAGDLYTLDFGDARIRKIVSTGLVTTYAGKVDKGFQDGSSAVAQFGSSFGIVTDDNGNIYIADSNNKRIRKINSHGDVITIAGNGEMGFKDGNANEAEFFFPQGIVIDKQGNLFVGDQTRIRKISPVGIVSTFAGANTVGIVDGAAADARFTFIEDMVIDEEGNIYASDENHIRKISPQGFVSTIAGTSTGYQDGEGSIAKFNGALGLGIDKQGNIYVADANNSRIRKLSYQ